MSFEVDTAFVQQYNANIQMLSQQMGSRLRNAVRIESQTGENGFYDQIGATAAQKRTTRHSDTPLISTPHARRRVTLEDYDWADLIDKEDEVRMLADPTSKYAINSVWAFGRSQDDSIITAALGDASTGKTGSTTTSFDTTNQQIAAASAGFTLAKLLETKEILDGNDVDESIPRFIAVTSKQVTDLLNTTEIKSADYNTVKALAMGDLDTFMGFKFIRTERLGVDGSSNRRCIAWAKDGILMAVGVDIKVRIAERPDKNHATQVFTSMSIGSTRMEEKKVVEILCSEA
jgi:hypothetical protein